LGALIQLYTSSTVNHVARIDVSQKTPRVQAAGVRLVSVTPDIATIGDDGVLDYVSDGEAVIEGRSLVKKRISFDVSQSGDVTQYLFVEWLPGSMGRLATDTLNAAIAGLNPIIAKPMYSIFNHSGDGTYTRNPACWYKGDVSAISVWTSDGNAGYKGATAITSRHIIMANHFPISLGSTLRFVGSDGGTVVAELEAMQEAGDTDFMIGRLSDDLPGTVTPVSVLPSNFTTYCICYGEHTGVVRPIPLMAVNQLRHATVQLATEYSGTVFFLGDWDWIAPTDPQQLAFYEPCVRFDSGGPLFVMLPNELALAATYMSNSSGYGVPHAHEAIQAAIDALEGE
jgi:hypothetical protein